MLQDDSNGETTFEIIEKKNDELSVTGEKTESISSMSSSASLLPSPSVSVANVPGVSGNLLSNVPPPIALPSFVASTMPISQPPISSNYMQSNENPQISPFIAQTNPATSVPLNMQPTADSFYPTQFSAAIPPVKGVQHGTISQVVPPSTHDSGGGGLIGWVKGAVSSGGLLSKVAEKAKNSVDSMITTLDPQMREFIYSGGDIEIIVASKQEIKISPIREAFQSVFGKATVNGIAAQSSNVAAQPVGFAAGVKAAEERIQIVLKDLKSDQLIPVVAVENFILEVGEDKWYDLGVLILNDPLRQITLQTFTQMTPVPAAVITLAQEETPSDYPLRWSGLSVTVGSLMASNLQVHRSEWHQALTGISRRDIILLAAKSLANLYKSSLEQNQ